MQQSGIWIRLCLIGSRAFCLWGLSQRRLEIERQMILQQSLKLWKDNYLELTPIGFRDNTVELRVVELDWKPTSQQKQMKLEVTRVCAFINLISNFWAPHDHWGDTSLRPDWSQCFEFIIFELLFRHFQQAAVLVINDLTLSHKLYWLSQLHLSLHFLFKRCLQLHRWHRVGRKYALLWVLQCFQVLPLKIIETCDWLLPCCVLF